MTAIEVTLVVIGIICVILSIVMGRGDNDNEDKEIEAIISTELTQEQKDRIRAQVNDIIDEEIGEISERTEASLDKISNTKILEMNEFAENVLGEINRNHNETVFLYDMLNEKAKEIKSTVKDVNITKRQVEKIHSEVVMNETNKTANVEPSTHENTASSDNGSNKNANRNSKDIAKERLIELVRKSNERARTEDGSLRRNVQAEALEHRTEKSEPKAEAIEQKKEKSETKAETVEKSVEVEPKASEIKAAKPEATEPSKDAAKPEATESSKDAAKPEVTEPKTAPAGSKNEAASNADVKVEIAVTSIETEKTASSEETAKETPKKTTKTRTSTKSKKAEKPTDKADDASKSADKNAAKTPAKRGRKKAEPVTEQQELQNIQFEKGATNNEKILKLNDMGFSNKDIAKQLNLGIGEVKLVIDLYRGGN